MNAPTIRPATDGELELVSQLAGSIWRAYYPSIISREQIEYMLARMYDVTQLRKDVERGVIYELVFDGERAIGFCGYERLEGELKLHKLYLEVSEHGRGIGSFALRHVEDEARRRGVPVVVLGVNRFNARALRAYERNGYNLRHELKTDIGGGFVMDDFILEKRVGTSQ
ncbi:MAG TPA: GNAT family N-acetyltransferase [Myxococcales bacterium]|nr:GNAT family N-acetyltransferase [Myxococcales bacterium]